MEAPEVIAKATDKLESLNRDYAALAAQEEGVRRKRAELQQEIAKLQTFVDIYRSLTGEPIPMPGPTTQASPAESISNLTFRFLSERGGGAPIADIIAWLVSIGKLPAERTHNNYSVVYATLMRDKRFDRPKPGLFRLKPTGPTIFGVPLVGQR